jgi:hypothetical protein
MPELRRAGAGYLNELTLIVTNMAAIDDVEVIGKTAAGTRTISIRNKTRDKTIAAVVHIGGACEKSIF